MKGQKWSLQSPVRGTQRLLRYPLLIGVLAIVLLELLVYFILRCGVIIYEWISFVCRGKAKRSLVNSLADAHNYEEFVEIAQKLDAADARLEWKKIDSHQCYDETLVKHTLHNLQTHRTNRDCKELSLLLIEVFNHIIEWMEDESLYNETYYGTKHLVTAFVAEVRRCLAFLRDTTLLPREEKLKIFARLQQEYGRSALCLSGGASMTYYQFGITKALFDNGLLPTIMSGTSGGSLVGAGIAVRTDEELTEYLTPQIYKLVNANDEPFFLVLGRLLSKGILFDWNIWRSKIQKVTKGNTTFLEAYKRTGRVFNVTAISDSHRPILMNYKNTPNVVIWSAVLASSSLPFVLPPSPLMVKLPDGSLQKFIRYGQCWSDGSIQSDIPVQRLLEDFNVRYTICAQCNPHVFPFYYNNRGGPNAPIRHIGASGMRGGFLSSLLEKLLKLEMRKWMRLLGELDLVPQVFGKDWRYTALQQSRGTVTIHPNPPISNYVKLIHDPTEYRMEEYFKQGQSITYPKMSMIATRLGLQKCIREAIERLDTDGDVLENILSHKNHSVYAEESEHKSNDTYESQLLNRGRRRRKKNRTAIDRRRSL